MESYETLGVIGEGTYGVVIKARHRASGQLVAIKKFKQADDDDHVRKTSLREVRVLKQLHHPNVVALLDVFRRDGKLYLVFEYIENTILQLLEGTEAGLKPSDVRRYMYQLLRGVEYCHAHSVIHRDVKPENILVSDDKVLKVCDFGFARHLTSKGKYTDYVATRWYRAPELLVGDVNYGKAVDIWAIGCIFAEISDTQPLFPGDSDLDQLSLILRTCGPIPQRLVQTFERNPLYRRVSFPHTRVKQTLEQRFRFESPDWLEFLLACLQTDPDKRPSCAELMNLSYFTRDNFRSDYEMELRRLNAPSLTPRSAEPSSSTAGKPHQVATDGSAGGGAGVEPSPHGLAPGVISTELPSLTLGSPVHSGPHGHGKHPTQPTTATAAPLDLVPDAGRLSSTASRPSVVTLPPTTSPPGLVLPELPLEGVRPSLPEIGLRRASQQPPPEAMSGGNAELDGNMPGSRGGQRASAAAAFPQLSVLWAQYLGESSSPGTSTTATAVTHPSPQSGQFNSTTTSYGRGSQPHVDNGGLAGMSASNGHLHNHPLGIQSLTGKRVSGAFNPLASLSLPSTTANGAEATGPAPSASLTGGGRYVLDPDGSAPSAGPSHLPPLAFAHGAGLSLTTSTLFTPSPTPGAFSPTSTQLGRPAAPSPLSVNAASVALQPRLSVTGPLLNAPQRYSLTSPLTNTSTAVASPVDASPSTALTTHRGGVPSPSSDSTAGTTNASPTSSTSQSPDGKDKKAKKKKKGNGHTPAIEVGASLLEEGSPTEAEASSPTTVAGTQTRRSPGTESEPPAQPLLPTTQAETQHASAPPSVMTTTRVRLDSALMPAAQTDVAEPRVIPVAHTLTARSEPMPSISVMTLEEAAIPSRRTTVGVLDSAHTGPDTRAGRSLDASERASASLSTGSGEAVWPAPTPGPRPAPTPTATSTEAKAVSSSVPSPTSWRVATPPAPKPLNTRPLSGNARHTGSQPSTALPTEETPVTAAAPPPDPPHATTTVDSLPTPVGAASGDPQTPAYRQSTHSRRSLEAILADNAVAVGLAADVGASDAAANPLSTGHGTTSSLCSSAAGAGSSSARTASRSGVSVHGKDATSSNTSHRRGRRTIDVEPVAGDTRRDASLTRMTGRRRSDDATAGGKLVPDVASSPVSSTQRSLPSQHGHSRGTGADQRLRTKPRLKNSLSTTTTTTTGSGTVVRKKRKAGSRRHTSTSPTSTLTLPSTSTAHPSGDDTSPPPALSTTNTHDASSSSPPPRVRNDTGLNLTPLHDEDRTTQRQRFAQYYRASSRPMGTLEKLPKPSTKTSSQRASLRPEANKPTLTDSTTPSRGEPTSHSPPPALAPRGTRRTQLNMYSTQSGARRGKDHRVGALGVPSTNTGPTARTGLRGPTLHDLVMAPYEPKRSGAAAGVGSTAGSSTTHQAPVDTHEERLERIGALALYTRPAHLYKSARNNDASSSPLPPNADGAGASGGQLARLRRGPGGNHVVNHSPGADGSGQRAKAYGNTRRVTPRTQPILGQAGSMKS